MKPDIMYIEPGGGLAGEGGRIGRVTYSKTGKTIYYDGCRFRSLKGYGYKENYYDVDSGEWYWISGPRRDANDALYPMTIEIDDDVREEYWRKIRNLPENVDKTSFRSPGKYSRRRPRPELSVHGSTRVGSDRSKGNAEQKNAADGKTRR